MSVVTEFDQYAEDSIDIEELKQQVKDEIPNALKKHMKKYNDIINSINAYEENIAALTPHQLSVCEFYYNKAEREAWKITGYYKSQYQFYNGKALTERGQYYIKERLAGGSRTVDVNDSNYKSRVKEGENIEIAGVYEGYYVTWKGIANSHQGMQTVYRDMMKAISMET